MQAQLAALIGRLPGIRVQKRWEASFCCKVWLGGGSATGIAGIEAACVNTTNLRESDGADVDNSCRVHGDGATSP